MATSRKTRSITPPEKKAFAKTFKKLDESGDVYVSDKTREAFSLLMRALNPYSRTKKVHAPHADRKTLVDIIRLRNAFGLFC